LQRELRRSFQVGDNFFWLGPIRDLLIFCRIRELFGRHVEWRGQYHGVAADKTLGCYE
jgi:hypothetical protein